MVNAETPENFIKNVVHNLPQKVASNANSYRIALAELWAIEIFLARDQNEWGRLLKAFFQMLKIYPLRLFDRGIASVFLHFILQQIKKNFKNKGLDSRS